MATMVHALGRGTTRRTHCRASGMAGSALAMILACSCTNSASDGHTETIRTRSIMMHQRQHAHGKDTRHTNRMPATAKHNRCNHDKTKCQTKPMLIETAAGCMLNIKQDGASAWGMCLARRRLVIPHNHPAR